MTASQSSIHDFPAMSLGPVPMPEDLAKQGKISAMEVFQGGIYMSFGTDTRQAPTIWRFDPVTLEWQAVLDQGPAPKQGRRRPMVPPLLPSDFPTDSLPGRYAGFVAMTIFQGASDAAPCLYVTTQSLTGAELLRSADGLTFDTVLTVPASAGYLGLTALTVWDDRLVMTSSAHLPKKAPKTKSPATDALPLGCVLSSRDPGATNQWEVLSAPCFDDPENLSITALTVHQGKLYAGTNNPAGGFQIWALEADVEHNDPAWTCVMRQGAARNGMNARVELLSSHHKNLWIGTATDEPTVDALDWPAAELLRIEPDGVWELIAGEARLTPQGLRLPLSLLGPGLDDPGVTHLSTMAMLPETNANVGLLLGGGPMAGLWVSLDDETWEPILQDELDALDEVSSGITAIVMAAESIWVAIHGRLYKLEHAG